MYSTKPSVPRWHSSAPAHPFLNHLREMGYSVTAPRRSVAAALSIGPSTIAQLATRLAPGVDRASVYRTVGLFEKLGLINGIHHRDATYFELSEVFLPHHHHATCQKCGQIIDIASTEIEKLLQQLMRSHGFLSVEHSLEVSGYCGECH